MMYACYTIDTAGRRDWSLNDGDSPDELRESLIRAGASWTPPVYYTLITIRDLSAAENAALEDESRGVDEAAIEWWLEHNTGHTCEYTADGGTQAPQCGAKATVMNPRSYVWFDYEEWFCERHADPAWLERGEVLRLERTDSASLDGVTVRPHRYRANPNASGYCADCGLQWDSRWHYTSGAAVR